MIQTNIRSPATGEMTFFTVLVAYLVDSDVHLFLYLHTDMIYQLIIKLSQNCILLLLVDINYVFYSILLCQAFMFFMFSCYKLLTHTKGFNFRANR